MMNTRRGIVFETTSSYSIFFTEDGVFEKGIPLKSSVQIGEETFYQPYLNTREKKVSFNPAWTAPILSVVATLVLLLSVLLPGQSTVSAYVQIDINPSIELGIDNEGTVYAFKGLNEDGIAIKRDIEFWKGKPLSWVLLQIVDRTESIIEETEKIEITTIYQNVENHENLEKLIVSAVSNSTNKIDMQQYSVNVQEASVEERKAANNEGISVQKYKAEHNVNKEEKQKKIKENEESKPKQKENKKNIQKPNNDSKVKKIPKNNEPKHQKQNDKQEKSSNKQSDIIIKKPIKTEVKHQSDKKQQNDSNREGKDNGQSKTRGNHPSEKKTNSDHQHDNPRQDKKGKNKDHERKHNDQKRKQEKNQSGKEQSEQGKNNNHKNH